MVCLFVNASNLDINKKTNLLIHDLEKVNEINQKIEDCLPYNFNYNAELGYFNMPSARMRKAGDIFLGFSWVSPYDIYSAGIQIFDHFNMSLNYWIFKGVAEGRFGHLGFGDDADRSANLKFSLLRKGDGLNYLPEIAIGLNDFIGSKRFYSKYLVITKDFLDQNLELSLGWGSGRIKGFFAGGSFYPFRKKNNIFKNLSFSAEYDANNYKKNKDEHPKSRKVKYPINYGIHFKAFNLFQLAISSLRGEKIAGSISVDYNFGNTKGLFPKYYDPLFCSSLNTEALGPLRTQKEFAYELCYAFHDQGFELYKVDMVFKKDHEKNMILEVINTKYRKKEIVRDRIQNILSHLTAENINTITVNVASDGIIAQRFVFRVQDLFNFRENKIGIYELEVLSPIKGYVKNESSINQLYNRQKKICIWTFRPMFHTYFGSSTGKFKYDAGMLLQQEGFLFNQLYYDLNVSYILKSSSSDIDDKDIYNPSQIINVRSDSVKYWQTNSFHVDKIYFQKNFNINSGLFSKISLGFFEIAYAGLAGEILYYPVNWDFAFAIEAATVLKRNYSGMGFQKKIRKLINTTPVYENYIGFQYFLDLYYDIKPIHSFIKAEIGQFLAKDKGVRLEFTKYYKSGFDFSLWITFTNKKDIVNGKRYFDKGFAFSIPIDLFMNKSSKTKIGYGIAPWLRDVGQKAETGKTLYDIVHEARKE